jgi:hypothetical protein
MSAAFLGTSGIRPEVAQAACTPAEIAAGTCKDITTSATVSGSAQAPNIECKWELPDMDLAATGIQYSDVETPGPAVDDHDDDINLGPTPTMPCALGAGPTPPTMANGAINMIQVRAPTHIQGQPVPVRDIELWAAVDHPTGPALISDVFWDIYQPCPSAALVPGCGAGQAGAGYALKVQVHYNSGPVQERDGRGQLENAFARGLGRLSAADGTCDTYGSNADVDGTMWNAAVETLQMAESAVEDPNVGMLALCRENRKAIYHALFQLTKDEPCGTYKVVATAVAAGGNFESLTNFFNVICNVNLQTDFSAVNWGVIVPGFPGDVGGDLIWGNGAPTIANGNNAAMGVTIEYGPMTSTNFQGKVIDDFDVAFGRSSSNLNRIGYTSPHIQAGQVVDLSRVNGTPAPAGQLNASWVLCANELGKIDFSIHPETGLPNDTYTGTLTLRAYLAEAAPSICYGNLHVTEGPVGP